MPAQSRLLHLWLLLPLILILPAVLIFAQEPKLNFGGTVLAWGSTCQEHRSGLPGGSRIILHVSNRADLSTEPLKEGWPEGYVLEAAIDLPKDRPFVVTSGLIEQLRPVPYWSNVNRAAQHSLLTGDGKVRPGDLNLKEFILAVPEDLIGHSLTFRARYRGEGADLISKPYGPISIIAACNQADTAQIVASWIYEAVETFHYSRAIELADSMLTCGLSDAWGWTWAEAAARGARQFDKAITYLDRMYEDFGVVSAIGIEEPLPLNRRGPRSHSEQAAYEKKRINLLQRAAEQQQEQH